MRKALLLSIAMLLLLVAAPAYSQQVRKGFVLQDQASTGNGTPACLDSKTNSTCFYITFGTALAQVTAGSVSIETAPSANFTGTWAQLALVEVTDTGYFEYYVCTDGPIECVRARIVDDIVAVGGGAGKVSVIVRSN